MGTNTDFFELPVGDQHRECIEVETDYDRGVKDERARWESKRCSTCSGYGLCNIAPMVEDLGCGLHEMWPTIPSEL